MFGNVEEYALFESAMSKYAFNFEPLEVGVKPALPSIPSLEQAEGSKPNKRKINIIENILLQPSTSTSKRRRVNLLDDGDDGNDALLEESQRFF